MVNASYPNTLAEALAAKSENPAFVPYAGGTDWMVNPRDDTHLLFLNYIPSLQEIRAENGELLIGACSTYTQLLESGAIPSILRQSIIEVASPAIRNLGTLGGNICNASPAGDTLPPLYTLDARVRLTSAKGSRELPLASFIQGVRKTALASDEILECIIIPRGQFNCTYYKKVGARSAVAISKVSFAGLMSLQEGRVAAIPMAFGSVAITVVRRPEIEAGLIGKTPEELREQKDAIAAEYEPYILPIDDQRSTAAYRKKVCLSILKDFLSQEE